MKYEYRPEWAKKIEAWGLEMEKKYGSGKACHSEQSEESRTGSFDCAQDEKNNGQYDKVKPRWKRDNHPAGDLFGQLISYLIITYIPPYFPGFFLEGWSVVFIIMVYSICIHVVVDLLLIILNARPFYYLGKTITNLASLVSMVVMVTIFPFNFPGNIGLIVQFGLWIAIAVVSIVTFFEFFKILGSE